MRSEILRYDGLTAFGGTGIIPRLFVAARACAIRIATTAGIPLEFAE
jgi:hypothetical protein